MRSPAIPGRPPIRTDWARRLPIRALRRLLQAVAVRPLLHAELQLEIGERSEAAELSGPVIIVANHSSRLDTPVVLTALPAGHRRRTGVAVIGDGRVDPGWRAGVEAVAFNTVELTVPTGGPSDTAGDLLAAGWNVLIFPEGIRSADGVVGEFGSDAAALALEYGVAVLPVGIRGTYAAMPRGRAWPTGRPFAHNRPRVSVRFGSVLHAEPDETATAFTSRISDAVQTAIAEDRTTWWQSRRHGRTGADDGADDGSDHRAAVPPAGSWRRIWEQSQSPRPGGQPRRPRIWRG